MATEGKKEIIPILTPLIKRASSIADDNYIFSKYQTPKQVVDNNYVYVSLGDSVAAGEQINNKWATAYGENSQYKVTGKPTEIVTDSYTDQVSKLLSKNATKEVVTYSYACSGDGIEELKDRVENDVGLQHVLGMADLITINIGAEKLLAPSAKSITGLLLFNNPDAAKFIEDYEERLNAIISIPENGGNATANSFWDLCDTIYYWAKKNARVVFLDTYNPYRFLSIDEGTDDNDYTDSFFQCFMEAVPNWEKDSWFTGTEIYDLRKFVYEIEHGGVSLKNFSDRINKFYYGGRLSSWYEEKICKLNKGLYDTIGAYNNYVTTQVGLGESNKTVYFNVARVKEKFDNEYSTEDKIAENAKKYPVNADFYVGQRIEDLDWGAFWKGITLKDLADSILEQSLANIFEILIDEVVTKNLNPHPTAGGHTLIAEAIMGVYDASGAAGVPDSYITVTYNSTNNEEKYVHYPRLSDQSIKLVVAAPFEPEENCFFIKWVDTNGTEYHPGDIIEISDNIALTQIEGEIRILSYKTTTNSGLSQLLIHLIQDCYKIQRESLELDDNGNQTGTTKKHFSIGEFDKTYTEEIKTNDTIIIKVKDLVGEGETSISCDFGTVTSEDDWKVCTIENPQNNVSIHFKFVVEEKIEYKTILGIKIPTSFPILQEYWKVTIT